MDPHTQSVNLVVTSKGPSQGQPAMPKGFVLDAENDNGEPSLDSVAGKTMLMEAKRKALTEEVFVEQSMLKAPDSFKGLLDLIEGGKAPASLFRLVNVDQSWMDCMKNNIKSVKEVQTLFDVFRKQTLVVKVKIIFCLKKIWATRVFEEYLSLMLERTSTDISAVMDLYHVAVILSFEVPNMSTAPADIFPYGRTASMWVERNYGKSIEGSVRSVMCSYYIRIVHNIFTMTNVSNMHHIKPILSKYNVSHQARVADTDGGVAHLVDDAVFPMLTQPRAAGCAIGVFLIVQMLSTKNPRLENFVRVHDFVTPLQMASRDIRYSHSRWACSHLMKLMLSSPNLMEHTLPCFGSWYIDACGGGDFDSHNIRFRFPFEFVHAVLKEGIEKGMPSTKQVEQWVSPIRHAFVLRAIIDGIQDETSYNREMRCLALLKLLLANKWTTRKDIVAFTSSPRFELMPEKMMAGQVASLNASQDGDSSGDGSSSGREGMRRSKDRKSMLAGAAPGVGPTGSLRSMKRGTSFFSKKKDSHKTLSRKVLKSSIDQQGGSGLLAFPEAILLRIFKFLPVIDLFTCCCVCWKMVQFVDNPAHELWHFTYLRDSVNLDMVSSLVLSESGHSHHHGQKLGDIFYWKQQCRELMKRMLPIMLYHVVKLRGTGLMEKVVKSEYENALKVDEVEAVHKEIVVVGLKMTGTLQRLTWWSEMDQFVESHWCDLIFQLAHSTVSLEVSKSAWRVFYQLMAYHPGMVDRFIDSDFLERMLRPLDLNSDSVVIFNGLYYLTKLLANDAPTADHRKRMSRKDVQTLAVWLKDSTLWAQWHAIYNAYQDNPREHAFIFPALASLFSAVHDSFLCKKLKNALFKIPEYRSAIVGVRDLARGKAAPQTEGDTPPVKAKSQGLSHDREEDMPSAAAGRKKSFRGASRSGGKKSEKRDVTASGVKVYRDCGRHGERHIDVEDGVALIRRNSDPGPQPVAVVADAAKRRGSNAL